MFRAGVFLPLYLLLIAFCLPYKAVSQSNFAVKNFTVENGLPHNHVRSIAQDQNGFLWVATWDGLSRWDGYEFRNYYHNPADSTTINNFLTCEVLTDHLNNVWISSLSGISKYNRESDNFTQFNFGITGGIALDKDGQFWVNSDTGLRRWNYVTNRFDVIPIKVGDKEKNISAINPYRIGFDNENGLWIYTSLPDKMLLYRGFLNNSDELNVIPAGTFDNFKFFPDPNDIDWKIKHIVTRSGDFFLVSNKGNYRFDRQSKQFLPCTNLKLEMDFPGLEPEQSKEIQNRISYFNQDYQNTAARLKPTTYEVETFCVDNQGTVWQSILSNGSIANGLTRKTPTPDFFKHHFFDRNQGTTLNAIFPVLKDRNGSIWAGPSRMNKLFRISKNGIAKDLVPFTGPNLKLTFQPRAFLEDSASIWIGYRGKSLLRYDFKTDRVAAETMHAPGQKRSTLPQDIVHLKKDGEEIYLFNFKSIFKYNIRTKEVTQLLHWGDENISKIYSVLRDGDKGWWIGASPSKLIHFDNQFQELKSYAIGTGPYNMEEIIPGDQNDLWISQLGGGLAHFDKATGKSKIYTTADGLSNNTCYGMQKDKKGNIWISTNHGISRFTPRAEQFLTFGAEDGLKIDEFNSDNSYQSPDGEMFFGGMGGVVSFYPDSLQDKLPNYQASPLLIEDFRVSGTNRYFGKPVYESDALVLRKGDNNFQATFACLDFRNAEKIKYRYRLGGENEEFVATDFRHRFLNYANLSPGNYRLEIEANNSEGEWVSKKSVTVIIPPYFYQTWWFRIFVILVGAAVAGLFIYLYNQRIRMIERKKQDYLRMESLQGQMNPHFIFNSLNSINYFISQNDRLSANRYIADFSRLIRSILGNSTADYIPLQKELESIRDYLMLEHLRFGNKFDYRIQVDQAIKIESEEVAPGMVQPFIENAIWHGVRGLEGRKGFVLVDFQQGDKPGCIKCIIEDDGIGRKLSAERKSTLSGRTSRGIGIVSERLRILNNLRNTSFRIAMEDCYPDLEETGTRVVIDLPTQS